MKIERSFEEEEVFASLKIHVYIALGGMVIPSLRCVAINWEPDQETAKLIFCHDGLAGEPMEWHYNCIEAEATSMRHPSYKEEQIVMHMGKVVSSPFPVLLPKVDEIVYLRKEPNSNFSEINTYVPDWAVGSVIRLKVNEALRGKVTGDLREIHLIWDEANTEALITFFHNGEIWPEIQAHYEEVFKIATLTAGQWKKEGKRVIPRLFVEKALYPEKIESPDDVDILYSRKEPFTDLPIGEK